MNNPFSTWADAEVVLSEGMPIAYIKSAGEPTMLIVKHNGVYGSCIDYDFYTTNTLRGARWHVGSWGRLDVNNPRNWRKCKDADSIELAQAIFAVCIPDPIANEKAQGLIQMWKDAVSKHPKPVLYTVDSHPTGINQVLVCIGWKYGSLHIKVYPDDAKTYWHHSIFDLKGVLVPDMRIAGYLREYPSMQALVDYLVEDWLKIYRITMGCE